MVHFNPMRKYFVLLLFMTGLPSSSCNLRDQKSYLLDELLMISKEIEIKFLGNNPDVNYYRQRIAEIAEMIKTRVDQKQPEEVVQAMNRTIFDDLKIEPMPDTTDITFDGLTILLRTRKASCVGLTSLYLVLADRLHLPLNGVLVAHHVFVRYQSDSSYINVETLRKGLCRTDEFYRNYFKPNPAVQYYLRNLTKKEFTAVCLFNLGNEYANRGLIEDAIETFKSAQKLFPAFKEVEDNLYAVYFQMQIKNK